MRGKAKYLEAKIASKIRNKDKNYKRLKKTNVLMLHIFKDSPFTNIDRNRIFADYYIWVVETLKIISKSLDSAYSLIASLTIFSILLNSDL